MESDGTAIISEGGPQAQSFQASSVSLDSMTLGTPLDLPKRLRTFGRRCAASATDLMVIAFISLFLFVFPLAAAVSFGVWESPVERNPTALSHAIELALQFAAILSMCNQFVFYPALCESGARQASPGKVLFGLKTTDIHGERQTFGGAVRRLSIKYSLFFLIGAVATYMIGFGSEFIASLRVENVRNATGALAILASFCLCLVTDREQNLYDIASGRLVVDDGTTSVCQRVKDFGAALRGGLTLLNPLPILLHQDGSRAGFAGFIARALAAWSYVGMAAAIVFLIIAGRIVSSLSEVEAGMKLQEQNEPLKARPHFDRALATTPGISIIYQSYYAYNENVDTEKQKAACDRLFAVRGNAQDYLYRGRLRGKDKLFADAEADYDAALSGQHGELATEDLASAKTEYIMLKLEDEATKMQNAHPVPVHTTPFDMTAPDIHSFHRH